MSRIIAANIALGVSVYFGAQTAMNTYDVLHEGDRTIEHNSQVDACAAKLGEIATTAKDLPKQCYELFDAFEFQQDAKNDFGGKYVIPAAEDFKQENTWGEAESSADAAQLKNNILIAGGLMVATFMLGSALRRRPRAPRARDTYSAAQLRHEIKYFQKSSLDELNVAYAGLIKQESQE